MARWKAAVALSRSRSRRKISPAWRRAWYWLCGSGLRSRRPQQQRRLLALLARAFVKAHQRVEQPAVVGLLAQGRLQPGDGRRGLTQPLAGAHQQLGGGDLGRSRSPPRSGGRRSRPPRPSARPPDRGRPAGAGSRRPRGGGSTSRPAPRRAAPSSSKRVSSSNSRSTARRSPAASPRSAACCRQRCSASRSAGCRLSPPAWKAASRSATAASNSPGLLAQLGPGLAACPPAGRCPRGSSASAADSSSTAASRSPTRIQRGHQVGQQRAVLGGEAPGLAQQLGGVARPRQAVAVDVGGLLQQRRLVAGCRAAAPTSATISAARRSQAWRIAVELAQPLEHRLVAARPGHARPPAPGARAPRRPAPRTARPARWPGRPASAPDLVVQQALQHRRPLARVLLGRQQRRPAPAAGRRRRARPPAPAGRRRGPRPGRRAASRRLPSRNDSATTVGTSLRARAASISRISSSVSPSSLPVAW